MTTSKKAFELAKAYRGKTVVVRNGQTNEKQILGLIQLIPGVPLIGVYLKNGVPKNWASTPVVFISDGKTGQGKMVDGELLVVTTAGHYIIAPWISNSNGETLEDAVFDEDVYCGITVAISSHVGIAISGCHEIASIVGELSIKE